MKLSIKVFLVVEIVSVDEKVNILKKLGRNHEIESLSRRLEIVNSYCSYFVVLRNVYRYLFDFKVMIWYGTAPERDSLYFKWIAGLKTIIEKEKRQETYGYGLYTWVEQYSLSSMLTPQHDWKQGAVQKQKA